MMRNLLCISALVAMAGCAYDEGLVINNLRGTVRLPAEAAQGQLFDANGDPQEVEDVGFIGPVFLGLYSEVAPPLSLEDYPHPARGPQFEPGVPADSYPYGGTTVGDFRFSCFTDMICEVVSGRFVDFDDLLDFYAAAGDPVFDEFGAEVMDGEYYRQTCFELLDVQSDREVRLTAEDRNDDQVVDEMDLDFVRDGDSYVAEFTIWQQEHFWDQSVEDCEPGVDCPAFWLWGFMDTGDIEGAGGAGDFTTCNTGEGSPSGVNQYDANFQGGAPFRDILTRPAERITRGDYVSTTSFQWNNVFDQPELVIDFKVE
jgi:hypothetical protein